MKIDYLKGDATKPQGDGNKVIVHCCNNIGLWGSGFVLAISKQWPYVKDEYLNWFNLNKRWFNKEYLPLGEVQFIIAHADFRKNNNDIWVANLIGQDGIQSLNNPSPIRYDAFVFGFGKVKEFAIKNNCSIHMPRIGCGLAGGKWEQVVKILETIFTEDSPEIFVYDL